MIKVHINACRIEIIFWDVIFWVMKILQHVRDRMVAFIYFIKPTFRYHLLFLIFISTLGFGLGFAVGFFRVNLRGW